MNDLADNLERACGEVSNLDESYVVPEVSQLLSLASQAVGVLRVVGDLNVKHVMYDMARLAASAGYTPEDFNDKANS